MTMEEAINVLKFEQTQICIKECDSHRGSWTECDTCKLSTAMDLAIEALETSDKRLEQAINKIAIKLSGIIDCFVCPCGCINADGSKQNCDEAIADWMKNIVEEVSE